ncbi:MAG TPA: FAD-dependent monooxygenase [Jatrophihabitans sp.]|nr:FAD-dependent monooxygenase [Jatrophihabitans sp.]
MDSEVIVIGAGPVGLMLAGELKLGGADVVLYEQRSEPTGESRGIGFTRRAAEVFDQRGLLERLGDYEIGDQVHFGGVRIDSAILDDNHAGVRGVPQSRIEEMLGAWVAELGVPVLREHAFRGYREVADGVLVDIEGPAGRTERRCAYLVGCDGGRSAVRQAAGIDFPGVPATRGMYVADVRGCNIRPRVIGERVPGGMVMAIKLQDGIDRIIIHPDTLEPRDAGAVSFAEIADSWQELTGESIHHGEPTWISAFTNATRQAAEYRRGRVLLAGDATHIHIPAGAQGLSTGVQDAVNLGWKLAATVRGLAREDLLDSYHAERHPAGARLLRNTLAQAAIYLAGPEMDPLRSVLGELVRYPEPARHLAGMVSAVSTRYDMHCDSTNPMLGVRLPTDWQLELAGGGRVRVAELLRPARGLFITTHTASADSRVEDASRLAADWSDRIDLVHGRWLPSGDPTDDKQASVHAALVRPDGYLAWVAPGGAGPAEALQRWFGSARAELPSLI